MRGTMRALTGLAAACALAACGLGGARQATPGAAPATTGRTDAAARYGLLTNGTICPTTGCERFVGAASAIIDVQGSQRTVSVSFDVTESGAADVGTITLVTDPGSTFTNQVAPTVGFDGGDVVVTAALSSPPPFSGSVTLTMRFARTDPTTVTASFGTPVVLPVTSFQALEGTCGPCHAYTASGRYGDPQRLYYFNVVDRGADDLGVISIDVAGDFYIASAATVTKVGDVVTVAGTAIRASDGADVAVRIEFNALGPATAAIYLDDLLIDPSALQTATSRSSCEPFPEN